MAKLLNLDAETGANIVDADATEPTLAISNASGVGFEVNKLVVSAGATITADKLAVNTPILAANATITGFSMRGASVASGAIMAFTGGALVSLTSVLATTGAVAGLAGIRVAKPDGTFGWIAVYPDAMVTTAVI